MKTLSFTIYGRPQQKGSMNSYVPLDKNGQPYRRPNGGVMVQTVDGNKLSKSWMSQVRSAAGEHMNGGELVSGPVALSIVFFFARPKSHFGSGKNATVVKPSAPAWHTQTPDVDKLVRCLVDGLSGVVFGDDKQVFQVTATKQWTEKSERAEVVVSSIQ